MLTAVSNHPTRLLSFDTLPPDMRVLIEDYIRGSRDDDVGRVPPTELPVVKVPVAGIPSVPLNEHDRGTAYAREMMLDNVPPIVIADGQFLDGKHRAFLARELAVETLLAIDLSGLATPDMIRSNSMGPLGAEPQPIIEAQQGPATIHQASRALTTLQGFIGRRQLSAIASGCRSEERQFFLDTLVELGDRVASMPKTYEQDGLGDDAIAYLHYFGPTSDFYITERDREVEQLQAFGQADLGFGPELGYISIVEILAAHVELDFHFTPTSLASINAQQRSLRATTTAEIPPLLAPLGPKP